MDEIRVNTADLRNGAQNLERASENINACMERLMSCSQGIDRGRDKGQFASQVERLLDDSRGMCVQRKMQMTGLNQELLRRAGLFEAANEAGASASLRINSGINDFWGKDNLITRFAAWAKHQNPFGVYSTGKEWVEIGTKIPLALLLATSFHLVKNRPNSFAMGMGPAVNIISKVVPLKTMNSVLETAGKYIPGLPKMIGAKPLREFLKVGEGTVLKPTTLMKTMAKGALKTFAPLEIAIDLAKETYGNYQREGGFTPNFFKTALVDGAARLSLTAVKVGVVIGVGALAATAPVAAPLLVLATFIAGPILIDKFVTDPLMEKWRSGVLRNNLVKDPANAPKIIYDSVTRGVGELVNKADQAFRPHINKLVNIIKSPFLPSPVY